MSARISSNIAARSLNQFCRGKVISITYSDYVPAALIMQLAKSMRPVMSSSVPCPALPYFSTLSHTERYSGGRKRHSINEYFYVVYTTVQFIEILSQMYIDPHV